MRVGAPADLRVSGTGASSPSTRLPLAVLLSGVVCAVLSLFTENILLSLLAVASICVITTLLWRPGAPMLLLFIAIFQSLEFVAPLVLANASGVDVGEGFPQLRVATGLGLVGSIVLALGMRIGAGQIDETIGARILGLTRNLSPHALLQWYAGFLFVSMFSEFILFLIPGTRQLLAPVVDLRWVFIVLLIWLAGWDPRARAYAVIVVLLEFVLGFGGFFSKFSEILYVSLVVVGWIASFQRRQVFTPMTVALTVATLTALTFWQAVKQDYRLFLNQGVGQQVVLESVEARVNFLWDRVRNISGDDMLTGFESGLQRLSYIEFFAMGIEQYPETAPYKGGALWGEAVQHILMPRVFFPDKPTINDSDRVRDVLGIWVAGAEEGTSITIGYFGESYIDFGPILMFVPIFLIGWLVGQGYKRLILWAPNVLFGCAIAISALMGVIGGSNVKMLGALVTSLVVNGILVYFFGERIWSRIETLQARATRANR